MLRRQVSTRVLAMAASLRWLTVTPVPMPALSPTMEKGKITEWSKSIGDAIGSGDSFCKVETDKAVVSYDNVADEGFLARILVDPGMEVAIGDIVCLLVDEKDGVNSEEVKNWRAANTAAAEPASAPAAAAASVTAAAPRANMGGEGRMKASPLARVTAKALGVSLEGIQGTGGGVGRIVKRDVESAARAGVALPAAAKKVAQTATAPSESPSTTAVATAATAAAPAAAPAKVGATTKSPPVNAFYDEIPVSNMRATIAKRLTQSKNLEIPHFYLFDDCSADNMLAVIKQLNAKGKGDFKITINDYVIKAVARANLLVPACNSSWQADIIRRYHTVDVSVAVATPDGLITPIIKNAHAKGLVEISKEMKALAKKARDGALQPSEFIGGTVSVSNLGASGISGFTAIINPPQSVILAVGTTKPRPKISKNAETGEFQMNGEVEMSVHFLASFDHRVVDGVVAAEWFKHFRDAIENPLSLLL